MTGEFKKKALASLAGRWGLGAGTTFLYYIISVAGVYLFLGIVLLLMIPFIGSSTEEFFGGVLYVLYVIATMFLTSIMMFGLFSVYVKVARGETVGIDGLFRYFCSSAQMWQAFKGVFLVGLYTFLWSLLLIIPGIIKSFSYAMTYFILIDKPEYTVHQAIAESKRVMQGRKMDLFLLMLSFIGWFLLCCITFGIAYFWIAPYATIAMAHFYLKISESGNNDVSNNH
jgi:uncharacterized membrane protein